MTGGHPTRSFTQQTCRAISEPPNCVPSLRERSSRETAARRTACDETSLDAPGVEREVLWVGDCHRMRSGGPYHGGVVGAQARWGDDQSGSRLGAFLFEGLAQGGVGSDPACHDGGGGVVEVYGAEQFAGEGLDYGGLVARGQV